MTSEKFCLRWNDFESNISVAFRELREDKDFFDVTLSCDDEQLQAHKVILSACSPFFRNILRRNPHQHPLLYLKGVKYTDLQSVLNFMYHGEVNVAQEELNSFLAVAEDLKVKGLTQNSTTSSTKRPKSPLNVLKPSPRPVEREQQPAPKRPRPVVSSVTNSPYIQQQDDDDDIQEVVPVKTEPRDTPIAPPPQPPPTYSGVSNVVAPAPPQTVESVEQGGSLAQYEGGEYEDYGAYEDEGAYDGSMMDHSMTGADGNKGLVASSLNSWGTPSRPEDLDQFVVRRETDYSCEICCQFSHASRSNVRNHVESKHFPNTFAYTCNLCNKTCNSKQALQQHRSKKCAKKARESLQQLDILSSTFQ